MRFVVLLNMKDAEKNQGPRENYTLDSLLQRQLAVGRQQTNPLSLLVYVWHHTTTIPIVLQDVTRHRAHCRYGMVS